MKILEVISSLKPIGGGETFAVNISRAFNDICTLKVVVLYKDASQMFIDRLNEKKIDYVFLDKQKHFDLKNAKELSQIIIDFKPDIIHTENNALIPTFLALRKIKKKKRPLVFHTMHLEPKDECSNRMVRLLYKHILKKNKYIPVAITESLSEKSKNFYKIKNVPFVENGVDLSRLNGEKEINTRKYDVTVVGRFSFQKNHEFLIKAFAKIKKIEPSFKVALVGGGELFEQTKVLANSLNADFIDFLGTMPNPGVILDDSKIIALGSRFEANPLSLIEGMAAGCVVVSTDVGGINNIIKPDNGFLFDLNDENTFIKIIVNIIQNISQFRTMSINNKMYSKRFSIENCAKQYLALFENHIKNR